MTPKKPVHHITVESERRRYPGMRKPSVMHRAVCICGWMSTQLRPTGEKAQADGDAHLPKSYRRKAKADATRDENKAAPASN